MPIYDDFTPVKYVAPFGKKIPALFWPYRAPTVVLDAGYIMEYFGPENLAHPDLRFWPYTLLKYSPMFPMLIGPAA